ncbi:MAG: response regulator [Spirochaetaceae bacterium]|jgi:putative two-component system response regulator|nr:response regulator [Spirochaetaceae bacterium]
MIAPFKPPFNRTQKGGAPPAAPPPADRRQKKKDLSAHFRHGKMNARRGSDKFCVDSDKFRVDAETFRVDSETFRVDSETFRVDIETFRVDSETFRVDAETFRVVVKTFLAGDRGAKSALGAHLMLYRDLCKNGAILHKKRGSPMDDKRHIIMLVDDNISTLDMGKEILKTQYTVFPIPSGVKFFEILKKVTPDLILLDVEMPDMDGYEVMRRLKALPNALDIPVVFVTAKTDVGSELAGLNLGAIDYIPKPFSPPLLLKRIETHLLMSSQSRELKRYNENLQQMVQEQTEVIVELQNALVSSMAEMVEFRDTITFGHILRTQNYLKLLAEKLIKDGVYTADTTDWDLTILIPASQLHDLGKIGIKDHILNKPGKFTPDEFDQMKIHTSYGVLVIEKILNNSMKHASLNATVTKFLNHAKIFAGAHHEKWDGTGYPAGLKGEAIPLEGRLMAIADVYDALISERPYKTAMSTDEAKKIIVDGKGTHFDPVLVDIFETLADKFAEIAGEC